jgi:signal transduction histidine kinase
MDTHSAEAKSPGTGEAAAAGQADAEIAASPKKRRKILPVLGLMLLGAAGWYGYDWWTNGRFLVSTDDAYIEGDIATISPKVSGYVAKVDVVDEGPGIPPDVLPHVFERFVTGTGSQGGLGLGLYLAKRIARVHGGDLTVESAPGKGARFMLTLPSSPGSGAARPAAPSASPRE